MGVSTPTTVQLPNGFTLILAPDEGIEAACVLTFHVQGTRDDPPDLRGGSFFYQYLMPLATENLEPYDRLMFIKRVGGVSSGRVNVDHSIFYQIVPDDRLAHALWMESERLSSLKILDRDINLQKANIHRQITRLRKTNVTFRAKAWVRTRVFENTVYQIPLFGDLDRIRGLNNNRIKQVYQGFADPANLIMVVSGKFNPAQVLDSVNKYFSRPAGGRGSIR